jgi:tetratricopeptide (TPR) repeat protein
LEGKLKVKNKKINQNDLNPAENFLKQGNYFEALKVLKSLNNKYDHFIVYWYLGHTYFKLHKYSEAIDNVKRSIQIKSKDPLNLNFLGEIYSTVNNYDLAIKTFEETLSLEKDNEIAILNLAKINLNIGEVKKAENYFKILVKKNKKNLSYIYSLIRINKEKLNEDLVQKIKKNYEEFDLENKLYSKLIEAKKDEFDKKYKLEIDNLIIAHKIYSSMKKKAVSQQYNYISNLLPKFIKKFETINFKSISTLSPIFIMGLPRSGTTLTERIIISGKNQIQSLGETDILDKIFFSEQIIDNYENNELLTKFIFNPNNINILTEKLLNQYQEQGLKNHNTVFTDKSISNFLYIELIHKIFPKAKFVYCYRNPVANVVGIFRSFLPNVYWSHSLEKVFEIFELYYKKLDKIKRSKSINLHIVELERLTSSPEKVSKELYNFLGLKWSNECIVTHNKNMIIKTASNLQVRDKIKKHNLDYIPSYLKIFNNLGFKKKWLG